MHINAERVTTKSSHKVKSMRTEKSIYVAEKKEETKKGRCSRLESRETKIIWHIDFCTKW